MKQKVFGVTKEAQKSIEKLGYPKPREHQIQQECISYLTDHKWYVMRLNSGKYSVGVGRNRRFILGQKAGTPDLLAFKKNHTHYPTLLFIEVKITGNKPTEIQKRKMAELEEYGATCIVVHSVDELMWFVVKEKLKGVK